MDLDSLRCFEAATTTLNFRAAAARVHLSPAAFSDRIARLEEELGVVLFARSSRRVELSDSGQRFLSPIRELITRAERLLSLGRSDGGPAPYELCVGTRYELGLSWLCPALEPLSRAHPERTIHLHNGDSPDLLARLERGDLDAIIASTRLTSPRLSYAALHEENYVFVSRSRCLSGRKDAGRVSLLDVSRDLPLFRYLLDAQPDAEPWSFARVEYLGGIASIRRRLFDRAASVAVLPAYFVRDDLRRGRLVRLLPRASLRADAFRLVWRSGHPRAAELLALTEELRRQPLR